MLFLLVHSKSNASMKASRSRLSLSFSRRVLEEPTLRARGGIVWNNIALDVPLADRREVVACRPSPRRKLFPEQIASGSEPLEGNFAIAVVFVAQDIEIVLPACHRQVGTPPVFHSLVLDMASGLETSDLIRAAAERHLQRRLIEWTLRVIVAGKNRQRRREQWDITCPVRREMRHHVRIISRFRADEVAQQLLGDRVALLLEDLERERDIVGGERAAVVEGDVGAHQKTVGQPVRGYLHRTSGKAVEGIRLVIGARHQAREGELHALRAVAPEDEDVKRIEREKVLIEGPGGSDLGERAALGRIGVDVVEMLKVGRIFEISESRRAVALGVMACNQNFLTFNSLNIF